MSADPAPPVGEAARIARLRSLAILDTAPEAIFDQCTRLAAELCETPIALISLIDAERQWFKSNVGLPGTGETVRDVAFCAEACQSDELLEVEDATLDARFAHNPMVTGEPSIRFYAGAPIVMPGGERVGALCVIDRVARRLSKAQRAALVGLGRMVATAMLDRERRLALVGELARTEARYRLIVEGQSELVSLADARGVLTYVNPAYAQFFGLRPEQMTGRPMLDFVAEPDRQGVLDHLRRVSREGVVASGVNRMLASDGRERWVAWTNRVVHSPDGDGQTIHSVGRDVTEQRIAESALAAAESRHRLLYESTPAMLHSIDARGRLLNVSDAWLCTLGYDRHEVIGGPSADFLTPESRGRAQREVIPAFFESGRQDDIEYQMVRKDGTVLDVLMSAVLERDASGRPARSLAVTQDVTDRKATARSLNDITHMLQLVLDSIPARISYWDIDSRNRFANRAFLADFGVTQQAIQGWHARDVLGAQWHERIRSHIDDGLAGRPGRVEGATVDREGKRHFLDMRFTPDLRDGQVRGLFVFALDVTARREAEREVAERDMRFKLLIDGVRDYAIYMLDEQGRVATWNAGAERNKGYRADEVIGQHFRKFFLPEDAALGKPERELALAAGEGRFETEDWRVRADGSRFWAGVLLSPLRDDRDRLIGYAKITRDITERRRQQAAMEQALAEKETLLKEVYHRVKNNLQVVQSLLNLQSHTLPDGAARRAIDDSVRRVRAMALVHEKLYQSGNLSAVSLPGYVRDLIEQLAEAHGTDRRRVRLRADIPEMQTGLDSAVPFGLLLTELITNCLKHAFPAERGGEVRVSLDRQPGGDLLTVADDGVGLPAGFVLGMSTASMGLQLAEGLARQLGGELRASDDQGATLSALLTRL